MYATQDYTTRHSQSSRVSHMTTDRYAGFAPTEWGLRVKRLRLIKGWTLDDLGKKCGVKKTTVSQWETGRIQQPEGRAALALSKALGVSQEWLLYGKEELTGAVVPPVAKQEPEKTSDDYLRDIMKQVEGLPQRERLQMLAAFQGMLDEAQRKSDVKLLRRSTDVNRDVESQAIWRSTVENGIVGDDDEDERIFKKP